MVGAGREREGGLFVQPGLRVGGEERWGRGMGEEVNEGVMRGVPHREAHVRRGVEEERKKKTTRKRKKEKGRGKWEQ